MDNESNINMGNGTEEMGEDDLNTFEGQPVEVQGQEDDYDSLDLSDHLFEYEEGDEKVRMTGEEIIETRRKAQQYETELAKLQEQNKILETLAPLLKGGQVKEERPAPQTPQQVQRNEDFYKAIGTKIERMLIEGEDGGTEALGGALRDFIREEFESLHGQKQAVETAIGTFKSEYDDFENYMQTGKVKEFQEANPIYGANPVEAYLSLKNRELKQKLADYESQVKDAETRGKKEGQQETLQTMKARGTLRTLTGGGKRPSMPGGGDVTRMTQAQVEQAMANKLREMRSS